eukprot:MONOS_10085.1-p1 / transcript=MONOS_10085.1 / gene=MONOS_10085 / organism=Monocercomonoides_exilis_PA203 / gene_product=Alg14 family oligosaccharide biosynthesis protein / transcript_product=Alg14 family oligosaccharide biosynthesis protein / location=Mono_scaffold00443:6301-7096(+) / protein_length=175 / sequence_SO=supercontig / SO=protein_coding / is_pseudo=false
MIVLGSGGHTKEMLALLNEIDLSRFNKRVYVIGATDSLSEGKAEAFENDHFAKAQSYKVVRIPRSREVLQGALSAIFPTVKSILASICVVFRYRPEIILCNGPGTCFPICVAAFVLKFFWNSRIKVVFVESYCRVTTLSTTGKLLYYLPLSDGFVVQWPSLLEKYSQADYLGRVV